MLLGLVTLGLVQPAAAESERSLTALSNDRSNLLGEAGSFGPMECLFGCAKCWHQTEKLSDNFELNNICVTEKEENGNKVTESVNCMSMHKKPEAKATYKNVLWYWLPSIGATQPKHIQFYIETGSPDLETCDLRLTSIQTNDKLEGEKPDVTPVDRSMCRGTKLKKSAALPDVDAGEGGAAAQPDPLVKQKEEAEATDRPWKYEQLKQKDVAFFRLGYLNYMKMNTANMVMRFKEAEWYKIDLLINWEAQNVSIYVNDEAKASALFFHNQKQPLEKANTLAIYGLSPDGKSKFRDLQVCNDIC